MLPYLDYAINQEFIAEELCENKAKPQLACNGKCYLQNELEKASQEESPTNAPENKKKTEEQTYICPSKIKNNWISLASIERVTVNPNSENTISRASQPKVPPPEFC